MQTGKEEADHFLNQYWADLNNFIHFPVDTVSVAVVSGLQVMSSKKLTGDFIGFLLKDENSNAPKIILDGKQKKNVQLFTCAHLIGRFIQSEIGEGVTCKSSDLKIFRKSDVEHSFANSFAVNLMLPNSALYSWWAQGKNVRWISRQSMIPTELVERKLMTLGML